MQTLRLNGIAVEGADEVARAGGCDDGAEGRDYVEVSLVTAGGVAVALALNLGGWDVR